MSDYIKKEQDLLAIVSKHAKDWKSLENVPAKALLRIMRDAISYSEAAKATGTAGEVQIDLPAIVKRLEDAVLHMDSYGYVGIGRPGVQSVINDISGALKRAARQPAPALPVKDEILKARQEGRMEALAIILREDAESPFNDQVICGPNDDAGDYSTYWNEEALRKLLYIDDAAYNAFDKAEEQYWDYRGYAIECENAEIQRRAALAATAAPVMQPEMKKIGWMWKKWGWTVTAHSKHREIHRVMDFNQPPESTKLSPDFISLEPIYIAATNRSQP